ncbi:MAG: hypothetical protein ABR936_13005 [Bacteroidota bacterium]|jgi:hypothetical protein
MTLKNATNIAIVGVTIDFIWMIISWINDYFDLIAYQSTKWFFKIWIIPAGIFTISLLIFFVTLSKKQKGGNNVQ